MSIFYIDFPKEDTNKQYVSDSLPITNLKKLTTKRDKEYT